MDNFSGSAKGYERLADNFVERNHIKSEVNKVPREEIEKQFNELYIKVKSDFDELENNINSLRQLIAFKDLYDADVMLKSAKMSILNINDKIKLS